MQRNLSAVSQYASVVSEEVDRVRTCRQIVMSSPHAWNPHQVIFPQSSRSVEEEMTMQRNLSAVSQYECVVSEEVVTLNTRSEERRV